MVLVVMTSHKVNIHPPNLFLCKGALYFEFNVDLVGHMSEDLGHIPQHHSQSYGYDGKEQGE